MRRALLLLLCFINGAEAEPFASLQSDRAAYQQGVMVLTGNVHVRGDKGVVRGDRAEISLNSEEGIVQGNVAVQFAGGEKLSCDYAKFDQASSSVDFYGNVVFLSQEGAVLQAQKMAVCFSLEQEEGCPVRQQIKRVHAEGDVRLSREGKWTLIASKALFDRDVQEIILSADDMPDSSLLFTGLSGKIFAKNARFDLDSQECAMRGDVKMIRREGVLEQYALADRVNVAKEGQEIRFLSESGRRVLFYDKINKLQMSAPELFIVKDAAGMMQNIKGVGNVRFHFKDEEYERLRQYFLLENQWK